MSKYSFLDRFREPSTWSALAAVAAIFTGQDLTPAMGAVTQTLGGIAALAGVFMAERHPGPTTPTTGV